MFPSTTGRFQLGAFPGASSRYAHNIANDNLLAAWESWQDATLQGLVWQDLTGNGYDLVLDGDLARNGSSVTALFTDGNTVYLPGIDSETGDASTYLKLNAGGDSDLAEFSKNFSTGAFTPRERTYSIYMRHRKQGFSNFGDTTWLIGTRQSSTNGVGGLMSLSHSTPGYNQLRGNVRVGSTPISAANVPAFSRYDMFEEFRVFTMTFTDNGNATWTAKIYVDGTEYVGSPIAEADFSSQPTSTWPLFTISSIFGQYGGDMSVGASYVWDRALTAGEVSSLATQLSGKATTDF